MAEAARAAILIASRMIETQIVNDSPPYPQCHASTIAAVADGRLVAAWFGGTQERDPDVAIYAARRERGRWINAVEIADGRQSDGTRMPTWNPVLFQPPGDQPLVLFYKVGPSPSQWWGMTKASPDHGLTWGEARRLPDGVLGPIKNKPVVLTDGSWLSPSSSEGPDGWHVHFERSHDGGKSWDSLAPVPRERHGRRLDAIQPSVLFHADARLQAICRTRNGVLASTWSRDGGHTWDALQALDVPNPNSGTDAVTLADGRQLLVYNHSAPPPERPTKGPRYPLDIAVSTDGVTWQRMLTLETEPCESGYAYPAVIQAPDGLIHITYTWDRKRIKHVVLDPKEL
jgi:predicted neuraminidase